MRLTLGKMAPLHEAIVRAVEQDGMAAQRSCLALCHRPIDCKGFPGRSDDKPLTIAVVDKEQELRDVLLTIRPMVREGLIGLCDFRGL